MLGGWAGLRACLLWPSILHPLTVATVSHASTAAFMPPRGVTERALPYRAPGFASELDGDGTTGGDGRPSERRRPLGPPPRTLKASPPPPIIAEHPGAEERAETIRPSRIPRGPAAPRAGHWEAQAYLFVRPGRAGASLGGGELGGSQIAARIAWRPAGSAVGVAARVYAPLGHSGAEAAAGLDWHPSPALPLRFSIERRQRLDAGGRDAWSAYAAGGFYRGGRPGALEIDGYGQAGVVGARRRDGFVDAALRIGYRLPTATTAAVVGAGLWGGAQPGVARIDIGPRASLRVPLADHLLTVALDGRVRVAGRARPGSGAALTIAADF